LAIEYILMLIHNKKWKEADELYQNFDSNIQKHETIQIAYASICLESGSLDTVEKILEGEFALIREGELSLSDLWNRMWAKRLADSRKESLSHNHFSEALSQYPPPRKIDFRML